MRIEFFKNGKLYTKDFSKSKYSILLNQCLLVSANDNVDWNKIWIYGDNNKLHTIVKLDTQDIINIDKLKLSVPTIKTTNKEAIKAIKYLYAAHTDEYNNFGRNQRINTIDKKITKTWNIDGETGTYTVDNPMYGRDLIKYNTQQFLQNSEFIDSIITNITFEQQDLHGKYQRIGYADKINSKTFEDIILSSAILLKKDIECYRVWGAFNVYNKKDIQYNKNFLVSASLKHDKHYEQNGNKAERYILPAGTYIIKFDDVFFADKNEILCFANDLKKL